MHHFTTGTTIVGCDVTTTGLRHMCHSNWMTWIIRCDVQN